MKPLLPAAPSCRPYVRCLALSCIAGAALVQMAAADAALLGAEVMSAPQKGVVDLRPKDAPADDAPKPAEKPEAALSARGATPPNFVFIVTDDQRWDATGFMQGRMESLGRKARFPHLVNQPDPANPVSMTPNMDRLSREGVHFDNGFCVYALCSPSRSVMLTGQYPHRNGITGNDQDFPLSATTYATLLRDAGWATGYFGKWHHGVQAERPGFDTQRSFRGQGHHYHTAFYDENGKASTAEKWVDEQTTDYALDFMDAQSKAGKPFLAFLGLKTPHGPRQDKSGKSNAPEGFKKLFEDKEPVPVPSLLSQGASPPPWKPGANNAGIGNDPRNYLRLISAVDVQIGRILDRLTELGISENTVVIYVSDNGYYIGEHGLGDKRAAYEEGLRIPFMIRYPALQPEGAGHVSGEIALNVDLAPTILDLAGLPVPKEMQGRSLRPLIESKVPGDWRDSFFFSYTDDPEYPGSVEDFIGVRFGDGRKLLRYAKDPSWDEFYQTSPAGPESDQYELNNRISDPAEASSVAVLQERLDGSAKELGFLEEVARGGGEPATMEVRLGETYPYRVETSTDGKTWVTASSFEGSGGTITVDLVTEPERWDLTVEGLRADHTLVGGNPVTANQGSTKLVCGADKGVGRDAVLVFELPALPPRKRLGIARLEVTAKRTFAKWWDADLWALGIHGGKTPIIAYHGLPGESSPEGAMKLQDAFFDVSLPEKETVVQSSLASGLSAYLRAFYAKHPDYSGGQHLFLRINPEKLDMSAEGKERYDVLSAESADSSARPKLRLSFQSQAPEEERFWRIGYGRD